MLFRAIDKDGNGKLDQAELQTAFRAAGLTVSNRRMGEFFADMDKNNDGYVTFDEWRYVQPSTLRSFLSGGAAYIVFARRSARFWSLDVSRAHGHVPPSVARHYITMHPNKSSASGSCTTCRHL